ncbi:hypothetical protein BHE74_00013132 [Ensete ventricosum]|nr:hypothetical protein BHE74_00013132 [Ensete ventricosum]
MMIGEGMVEEEVAAVARATVGEVGCDREGRKMRMQMRLWLRRKGDGGQRLGRKAIVKRMGSDWKDGRWQRQDGDDDNEGDGDGSDDKGSGYEITTGTLL